LKILQVGTFPIRRAEHGGQRRVAALHRAYRTAGMEARYVALFSHTSYAHEFATRQDIAVGPATHARIASSPWLEDLIVGECLLHDTSCRDKFLRFWRRFQPDAVAVEQPYPWASLRQLIRDGVIARPALLIHSSQNVESQMKADLYARLLPGEAGQAAAARVKEVEDDLTRECDLLVAVHQNDADRLLHAASKPCVLLRNGGEVRKAPGWALRKWRKKLAESPRRRRAFFVGSAHPPNLHGFDLMLGPSLGFLPPDCEILVTGGVCDLFRRGDFCTRPVGGVNESRLRLLGQLPDPELAAVIELSQLVLLPITSGGGSNLKTVEALLSGKPIVATSYAFRAYEEYSGCGRVTLADDPAAFKQAVVQQLQSPDKAERDQTSHPELEALTWPRLGQVFIRDLQARLAEMTQRRQRQFLAA
jgi:glycosyltransferase involved in cell wall biosynthesis